MNGAENTFEEIMATKSTNSVKKTCFETHIYLRSLVNSKLDKFNINTHTHTRTHTHTHLVGEKEIHYIKGNNKKNHQIT